MVGGKNPGTIYLHGTLLEKNVQLRILAVNSRTLTGLSPLPKLTAVFPWLTYSPVLHTTLIFTVLEPQVPSFSSHSQEITSPPTSERK